MCCTLCWLLCVHHTLCAGCCVCTILSVLVAVCAPYSLCWLLCVHHTLCAGCCVCTILSVLVAVCAPYSLCWLLCVHHTLCAGCWVCTILSVLVAGCAPYSLCWLQELKLKYYRLMIELCQHDHDYPAICRHYRAIFDTPCVQEDETQWKAVSASVIWRS